MGTDEGRAFTCLRDHSLQRGVGILEISAGDRGVLIKRAQTDGHAYAMLYRDKAYHQATVILANLRISDAPTTSNTVGYPAICYERYKGMNALDECSIVGFDEKTCMAQVSIAARNIRPWVRVQNLHIGNGRKFGDVEIEIDLPSRLTVGLSIAGELTADDFPITRILFPLHLTYMKQSGSLKWMNAAHKSMLSTRIACLQYARKIAAGVPNGHIRLYDPAQKGHIGDFVNYGLPITKNTQGSGVYGHVYRNFKETGFMAGQKPRTRVGKTSRPFGSRHTEHEKARTDENNGEYNMWHYKIARQARERHCFVLVHLPGDTSQNELSIAEQDLMLILRAYRPEALTWVPAVAAKKTVKAKGDEVRAKNFLLTSAEAMEAATQLDQIAQGVFEQVGWTTDLGISGGCNWDSPMASGSEYDKLLWIIVEHRDRCVYYRTPTRLWNNAGMKVMFQKFVKKAANATKLKLDHRWWQIMRSPDFPAPAMGEMINCSVEIMKQGRHPHAYCRMPDYGLYTNLQDALGVAFRICWPDPDDAESMLAIYLEEAQDGSKLDDKNSPATNSVWGDMAMLRYFLEQLTVMSLESWMEGWGLARVKEMKFDHLTQTLELVERMRPANLFVPIRTDAAEVKRQFEAHGLKNYGKLKTDFKPEELAKLAQPNVDPKTRARDDCDCCYAARRRHFLHPQPRRVQGANGKPERAPRFGGGFLKGLQSKFTECNLSPDGSTCEVCFFWGCKCTFSDWDTIERNKHLLYYYPPSKHDVDTINDPDFVFKINTLRE